MSRGKYLSLEEARKKKGGLDRFAKEHPSEGTRASFDRCLARYGRAKAKSKSSNIK